MAGPATKYSFDGIGGASASLVLGALAANPSTLWLTTGFIGSVVRWCLTRLFSMLASTGLVILNVGAERIQGLIEQHDFDNSFDSAEKLLAAARDAHQTLSPEQIKAIDDPVIRSFRKFASFARQK